MRAGGGVRAVVETWRAASLHGTAQKHEENETFLP
jgi:hypothetical protein